MAEDQNRPTQREPGADGCDEATDRRGASRAIDANVVEHVIRALLTGKLRARVFDRLFNTFPSTRPECVRELAPRLVITPTKKQIREPAYVIVHIRDRREFRAWLKHSASLECAMRGDGTIAILFQAFAEFSDSQDVVEAMRRESLR